MRYEATTKTRWHEGERATRAAGRRSHAIVSSWCSFVSRQALRLTGRVCGLLNEGLDVGGGPCAGRAGHLAATGEDGQRGDRADVQPLTEIVQDVGIDLDDEKPAGGASGDFDEFRRDHP